MDKLVAIRIKYDDQTYSEQIPVSVLAENVQWDESSTLIDILGSINLTRKGNIQDQIDELHNRINNIHDGVTSVNGKTGTVVLNAADVGAGTGNYNKPISGIPKTDLASSVQTSLEKADTALQSYTETDPTVPAWAKQPNKPTYTAQEVGALPADSQIAIEVDDTLSIQGAAADAKAVGDAIANNPNTTKIITSTYSDSKTYDIGSLALYEGSLFRCKTKIETPEVWTRNHWDLLTIQDSLTPLELGFLWTTCRTAENDLNKIINLFTYGNIQYNPKPFGIIGVHFYNAVPAGSTLDVNNTGAKPIYKGTTPIGDGEIKAGDNAYFMLNGIGRFEFIGVDSYGDQIRIIQQNLENQQSRAETTQALKVNKPITDPNGTNGQILQTDGQGGTVWVDKQTDEQIATAVTDWLDDHVTPGASTIVVDDTLSISGAAADAKKTGDEITSLKEDYDDIDDRVTALEGGGSSSGLTEDIKAAMLQIAQKVAYIDEHGQDYYDDLYDALYPPADLVSISAVYTQSGTVYDTDTLESLKADLVVTAHMSDQTTRTVTEYTLSGTLTTGTSTITVTYGGKTTTFNVTVSESPRVPTGYTEYRYIEKTTNSNSGIVAPITMSSEYIVELSIAYDSTNGTASNIIGTRIGNSGTKEFGLFVTPSSGKVGYWYDDSDTVNTINAFNGSNAKNTIKVQPVGLSENYPAYATIVINGTEYSLGSTATGKTWSQWLGVFRYAVSQTGTYGTNSAINLKIGEIIIKDLSGNIIYDLIPCTNGTHYGFYERITGNFCYDSSNPNNYTGGDW